MKFILRHGTSGRVLFASSKTGWSTAAKHLWNARKCYLRKQIAVRVHVAAVNSL